MVKICDFGLARDIYKDPDYVRKGSVSTGHSGGWGLWAIHPGGLRTCTHRDPGDPAAGEWRQELTMAPVLQMEPVSGRFGLLGGH